MTPDQFVPVIDIAYYQGDVDFAKVRDAGIVGVIARASDGWRRGADPRWYEYALGATAAGLPLGSYWYVRPLDDETAEQQAARWLGYVDEAEHRGADVRFLMLDVENYWRSDGVKVPPEQFAEWLDDLIDELRRLGWRRPVVIYTGGPFWRTYVNNPNLDDDLELGDDLAAAHDIIIARYPRNNTPPPSNPAEWAAWALDTGRLPEVPAGADRWDGWQFTSSLHGPDVGIEATRVDANIIQADAWAAWTGTEVDAPLPDPAPAPEPTPDPPAPPAPRPTRRAYAVTVNLPRLDRNTPRGDAFVVKLQRLLNIVDDGWYGEQTEAAVRAWQTRHGLTVDGWVGGQTWASVLTEA